MTELLRPFVVQFWLFPAIQNDYVVFSLSLFLFPSPSLSYIYSSTLSPSSAYVDESGGEGRPHRLSMSRHTSNFYSSLEQYTVSTSSIDSGNVSMSSSGSRSRRHKRGVCIAHCTISCLSVYLSVCQILRFWHLSKLYNPNC